MVSLKITMDPGDEVTAKTLALGPVRLLMFLTVLGMRRAISQPMTLRGWSDARKSEGWALLAELKNTSKPERAPAAVTNAVAADIATCEAFQADDLPCARAFLEASHREQATFLFHDYVPGRGGAAVLNVVAFLDRYEDLEKGADRKATRKADHAAIALITLSGTTKEKLKMLRRCVERVQSTSAPPDMTPAEMDGDRAADEARLVVLRKIHAFMTLWSQVARRAVKRRDHLILLGIAKRHPRAKKPVATPAPPAPVATPVSPAVTALDEKAPPSRAA